jgi:glycosyltransferase involved in cell wall biosynthesis
VRVFGWQTDGSSCHLYRTVYPFTHLPDHFTYEWGAPGPDIFEYDVVVGQRLANQSDLWEKLCDAVDVIAVYDLDDWLPGIDPENTVPYNIYHPIEHEIRRNIQLADVVTVATPKLAQIVADELNPNVVVLENCMHPLFLNIGRSTPAVPTVGWAGSIFHQQDWTTLPHMLQQFHLRHPGVQFNMMGGNFTQGLIPVSRFGGYTEFGQYLHQLDFSVGLAPLMHSQFNDMKSWCKALEYATRGIPIIASKWGQYPEWVTHGVNGYLVENDDEWVGALTSLLFTPNLLEQMSNAAHESAQAWTIDKHVHKWVDVYEGRW